MLNDKKQRLFIRSLKELDCYHQYIHNRFEHCIKHRSFYNFNMNDFFVSIMSAFDWSTTKEGGLFWSTKFSECNKFMQKYINYD